MIEGLDKYSKEAPLCASYTVQSDSSGRFITGKVGIRASLKQTSTLRQENSLELRETMRTGSHADRSFQGKKLKISQVTVLQVSSVKSVCSQLLKGERISLQ